MFFFYSSFDEPGIADASAVSGPTVGTNDHEETGASTGASAVSGPAVDTNDKGETGASTDSSAVSGPAVGTNNRGIRTKGAIVVHDKALAECLARAREYPQPYELLETHVWFATLPQTDIKSLLAMCDSVPTDSFRDNSAKGDVGFENEPSFEIETPKRRRVNFRN